jgi:uncharacterized protein (UPF0262 family)
MPGEGEFDRRERIVDVELDEGSVVRWNPEIDHERNVAIFDLLESNHFEPVGDYSGPYALRLAVEENRIVFDIRAAESGEQLGRVLLPQAVLRRVIKDYFKQCESYFEAIRTARPGQIEALDMGRRGLHNEGSEILMDRLAGKIHMDFETARRLFTLVCVLHLRS